MMRRNGSMRVATLAVVATVGLAATAGAQWRVTGFGGVYAPTTNIGKYTAVSGTTSAEIAMKHKTGFIVGLNANRWFAERAGFEGTFGYVNSDATTSAAIGGSLPIAGSVTNSGYLFLGAAKLLYGITPHESRQLFYLSAGPAIIGAGGSAYKDQGGVKMDRSTSVGGVAGVAARMHLNELLCLKLGADDYMYSSKVKLVDTTTPANTVEMGSKFQNDLVFSAGVSVRMPW